MTKQKQDLWVCTHTQVVWVLCSFVWSMCDVNDTRVKEEVRGRTIFSPAFSVYAFASTTVPMAAALRHSLSAQNKAQAPCWWLHNVDSALYFDICLQVYQLLTMNYVEDDEAMFR